jgi:hypothetical protein
VLLYVFLPHARQAHGIQHTDVDSLERVHAATCARAESGLSARTFKNIPGAACKNDHPYWLDSRFAKEIA